MKTKRKQSGASGKKFGKVLLLLSAILAASLLFTGCGEDGKTPSGSNKGEESETPGVDDTPVEGIKTTVILNGSTAEVKGEGATFADGRLSITQEGSYELKGTLEDGQIYVNVQKTEKVELYLNGVSITCGKSSPIFCESADKLVLRLAEGTVNSVTDSASYQFEGSEDEPNACIFSRDDISVKGTGTLNVVAKYKNGISSKNDIKFADATVSVNAVNTGVRGKDSVTVESGGVTVKAGNDGLKSTTMEQGKGYILISGGVVDIDAEDDALQAENDISVTGGSVTTRCGGKTVNCPGTQTITDGCLTEK